MVKVFTIHTVPGRTGRYTISRIHDNILLVNIRCGGKIRQQLFLGKIAAGSHYFGGAQLALNFAGMFLRRSKLKGQKEDGGKGTELCQWSANIAFLQSSGHLGRAAGVDPGRRIIDLWCLHKMGPFARGAWTLIPMTHEGLVPSSQPSHHTTLSQLLRVHTMQTESKQPEGRAGIISALNEAVEAVDLAGKTSAITPAKDVFGSVGTLLTLIRVCFLLSCNNLLQIYI